MEKMEAFECALQSVWIRIEPPQRKRTSRRLMTPRTRRHVVEIVNSCVVAKTLCISSLSTPLCFKYTAKYKITNLFQAVSRLQLAN